MKLLSIYIHIPFCVQKCVYCDFLSAPANNETKEKYVQALKREIKEESRSYKEYKVKTVFFGGGTPSILKGEQLTDILDTVKESFDLLEEAEITIEMNPKTATMEKMRQLAEGGINRLSIGLQSANDNELKLLGRVHDYRDFLETYNMARECGIKNINVDLMSAIPGQTLEGFMDTLKKVISLNPEHISAYSLIVEENTYLYDNLSKFPELPSEDEDRLIYQETKRILKEAGYERYEISNYSKKGYECKHNLVYWERGDYAGFGLGASSLVENKRWKNTEDLQAYLIQNDKLEVEDLDTQAQMEEFMFLGLRKMDGISKKNFFETFNTELDKIYGDILNKWKKEGYLIEEKDRIYFSEKGIDISNQILADFIF